MSIAAGGMWQGVRGDRQWLTYITLAAVAWIGTLVVLMAGIIALVSWFFGSFHVGWTGVPPASSTYPSGAHRSRPAAGPG